MKVVFLIFLLTGFLLSCHKSVNENNGIKFNPITGVLEIDYNQLKAENHTIKKIVLKRPDSLFKQNILLDGEQFSIESIENRIVTDSSKNYLNTWYKFSKDGSYDYDQSYFYEIHLGKENKRIYVYCMFPASFYYDLENKEKYILIGDFSKTFTFPEKMDTIYFDNVDVAKIPIDDYIIGKNNIRFVIVDEARKNKEIFKNYVYISKDFYIER